MTTLFRYIIVSVILTTANIVASATEANDIIEKFISTFESAKSLTMRYNMSIDNSESTAGIMCIRGEKFKINSAPIAVWYDGNTQWTYMSDTKEVSVTEPTPEEIADINPFVIINNFRKGCDAKITTSTAESTTVVLTPRQSGSGLQSATIVFANSTSLPRHIELNLKSGASMSLDITSITRDINYPPSTFVFSKDKYPDATIVDLR